MSESHKAGEGHHVEILTKYGMLPSAWHHIDAGFKKENSGSRGQAFLLRSLEIAFTNSWL